MHDAIRWCKLKPPKKFPKNKLKAMGTPSIKGFIIISGDNEPNIGDGTEVEDGEIEGSSKNLHDQEWSELNPFQSQPTTKEWDSDSESYTSFLRVNNKVSQNVDQEIDSDREVNFKGSQNVVSCPQGQRQVGGEIDASEIDFDNLSEAELRDIVKQMYVAMCNLRKQVRSTNKANKALELKIKASED